MAEAAALSFASSGFDVIVLRPMLVMLRANAGLVARRRAEGVRWLYYYIAPEDAGRAFLAALEAPPGRGGIYFVTAADSCHDEPTLDWMSQMLGERLNVRDRAYFAANPRASVFDGRRAREVLGFTPQSDWITLSETLRENTP
jgi:nucleoside-diphosphate-sugar epimerase